MKAFTGTKSVLLMRYAKRFLVSRPRIYIAIMKYPTAQISRVSTGRASCPVYCRHWLRSCCSCPSPMACPSYLCVSDETRIALKIKTFGFLEGGVTSLSVTGFKVPLTIVVDLARHRLRLPKVHLLSNELRQRRVLSLIVRVYNAMSRKLMATSLSLRMYCIFHLSVNKLPPPISGMQHFCKFHWITRSGVRHSSRSTKSVEEVCLRSGEKYNKHSEPHAKCLFNSREVGKADFQMKALIRDEGFYSVVFVSK